MVEKQTLIIEEAIKLIAEKGYHATSVQDIVKKCEMAKGSFYKYFRSKEELLISIFKYYHELITASVLTLEENPHMNSKDKFLKQLDIQIVEMTKHTGFIQMIITEQMIGISKELDDFLYQVERDSILWFREKIMALFPNLSEEYYADCTLLLDILFKGCLSTLIREPGAFDKSRLPEFIYNRLESIIVGYSKTNDFLLDNVLLFNSCTTRDLKTEIESLLKQAIQMENGPSKRLEVYQVIQQELLKEKPNGIILESLVLLLESNVEKTLFTRRLINVIKNYMTTN